MEKLTIKQFDSLVEDWLLSFDECGRDEYYFTPREMAETVLAHIRVDQYSVEIEKENRYQEYLKLKAEFEPEKS